MANQINGNLSFNGNNWNIQSSSFAAVLNPNPSQNLMIGNPNAWAVNPNVSSYAPNLGPMNIGTSFEMILGNDVIRESLIQKFAKLEPDAQKYWDNLFSKNTYKRKGKIPIGAITYPLTIWATENPVSFEWRIEQEFPSRVVWDFEEVCTIPTRHKFLDRNFLDSNSIIIQFNPIKARPIVLDYDEPLISWYTGFVVETSYIQDNA